MKMRKLVLAVGMLSAVTCLAGVIRVGGVGTASVAPDMMRLRFDVEAIDQDMAKSAELFGMKNAAVMKALLVAGVTSNEVATSRVDMEPRYHYEDKDGNDMGRWGEGKRVFDGYCHSTEYKFSAPLDRDRLEKVYKAVVACKTGTEINLDFFVKDTKMAQSQARRRAVANALASARELCEAAGTALGDVEEIAYAADRNGDVDVVCCAAAEFKQAAPVLPAIKIRDVEVSDRVTITWKLKD